MEFNSVKIHPSATVSEQAKIGSKTQIWNQCQVREDVRIGQNCILGKDVYVDFGVQIGDDVKIQNGSYIYHGTTIEGGVFIGPGVIFTNDKLPRAINPDGSSKENDDWEVGETYVMYGASIGAGSVILPGLTIGRFALIGAGAMVTRDIPDYALAIGSPARQVGFVCKCAARLVMDKKTEAGYCPVCDEQYQFER
ncbi:MAG: N-acetyltransferase [Anaerolineae bacterium]|nr:N-acetyltransferase [Anaerolineae bacterium]